jgi:hypothetical protein
LLAGTGGKISRMAFGGRLTALLAAVAILTGLAACGSSSKSKPAGPTGTTPAASGAGGIQGAGSVTSGPVHATFRAPNHDPTVGKPWPYSVHVSDANGHPLNGSVKIQFTFGGQVVGTDTPPVHPIKHGLWHDNLTFPKAALGQAITLQAVVHTSAGSVTLSWPVTAHK